MDVSSSPRMTDTMSSKAYSEGGGRNLIVHCSIVLLSKLRGQVLPLHSFLAHVLASPSVPPASLRRVSPDTCGVKKELNCREITHFALAGIPNSLFRRLGEVSCPADRLVESAREGPVVPAARLLLAVARRCCSFSAAIVIVIAIVVVVRFGGARKTRNQAQGGKESKDPHGHKSENRLPKCYNGGEETTLYIRKAVIEIRALYV